MKRDMKDVGIDVGTWYERAQDRKEWYVAYSEGAGRYQTQQRRPGSARMRRPLSAINSLKIGQMSACNYYCHKTETKKVKYIYATYRPTAGHSR